MARPDEELQRIVQDAFGADPVGQSTLGNGAEGRVDPAVLGTASAAPVTFVSASVTTSRSVPGWAW